MSDNQPQNMQVDDEITKLLEVYKPYAPTWAELESNWKHLHENQQIPQSYFLLPEEPDKEHDEEREEEKNDDHHPHQITTTHDQCTYFYQYESIQEENFYETHDGLLEGELSELRNFTKEHQQRHTTNNTWWKGQGLFFFFYFFFVREILGGILLLLFPKKKRRKAPENESER